MIQSIQRIDADTYTQRVTLGGEAFQVRLSWRERIGGWYADVSDRDGNRIISGRRLAQGWSPTLPVRERMRGLLLVIAPQGVEDDPDRTTLLEDGRGLMFAPDSEIREVEGSADLVGGRIRVTL